ncbi:MAG TPA: glutamine-hydrolyzing carbamoyl-phosphate synthase small subunit [Longimicrobiales bacterium]|nr:glutamine-hydrolyzing carbamoyl-phosphate synthase small subunit [Longimicrobiales bacterium]
MKRDAYLMLEDGRSFPGVAFGAPGPAHGEAVFNTVMCGYQEVLTDPSYAGQIVVMTAPQVGNYGVNRTDPQSRRVQVAGFVVRDLATAPSGWRSEGTLDDYLRAEGVAALSGVDTRALTRHIRSAGAMRAAIAPAGGDPEEVLRGVREQPSMEGRNLAYEVTTDEAYVTPAVGERRFTVASLDFGVKSRSLDMLAERGCESHTLPARATLDEIVDLAPDGIFVSNGPGDPAAIPDAAAMVRAAGERGIPIFGICLGCQLVSRAWGGSTYKLLYGHRGGNHPVKRVEDGAVEITSQNHGFAIRADEAGAVEGAPDLVVTHWNLNDGTVEGVAHRSLPVFAVQYHPEAAPGPHDATYLFDRFIARMEDRQKRG